MQPKASGAGPVPTWVLSRYGLLPSRVEVVSSKPKRVVWRVTSGRGIFALKAAEMPLSRVRFVTAAHAYLRTRCDLVPMLLACKSGDLFAHDGSVAYTLMEWVEGRRPDLADPGDVARVAGSLAHFHQASHGFSSPEGASARTDLGCWPARYRRDMDALDQSMAVARRKSGPVEAMFLDSFDFIAARAEEACRQLEQVPYRRLCDAAAAAGGLCHRDFAPGNLAAAEGGVKVYDLDSVTIDLPVRDLGKLLDRVSIRCWGWNLACMEAALAAYAASGSLSAEHLRVLLADLTFPHLVVVAARKYFLGQGPDLSMVRQAQKLGLVLAVELTKPTVLAAFRLKEGITC